MSNTTVSVIIATLNRAESLKIGLAYLVDQTVAANEVIIIDNGSIDHTRSVVESFSDKLIIHYFYEPKQGVSFARNRGIREARMEIILFMDDDCRPRKDWVGNYIKRFDSDPGIGMVGGLIVPELPKEPSLIDLFSYDMFSPFDPQIVI